MRDQQRSKLYAAERVLELTHAQLGYRRGNGWNPAMSIQQAQRMVDHMLSDLEVLREFDVAKRLDVQVLKGKSGGRASGGFGSRPKITLGNWALQEHVVIHELAHHLAGLHAAHDYTFANVCWWLTSRFMGAEKAELLRKSYVEHEVKYSGTKARREPPKQLTARQSAKYRATFESVKPTVSPFVEAPPRTLAAASTPSSDAACTDCGTTTKKVGSGGRFKTPLCNTDYRKRMAALKS